MLIINDQDTCPECGAYYQGNGYCVNGHPRKAARKEEKMGDPAEWHAWFHESTRAARMQLYYLDSLARAFRRTGNQDVADELADISDSIDLAIGRMNEAVGRHIHESSQAAREDLLETTAAVLKHTLHAE